MGRLARQTRPPPSGTIIFYGRSVAASTPASVLSGAQNIQENNENDSRASSIPSGGPSGNLFKHDNPTYLQKTRSGNHSAILKLITDVLEVFEDVPYVKMVAGLVKKILTISDEIQTNKSRGKELVEKVLTYGRVVFEALLTLYSQESKELSSMKTDLTQIAIVLQSIYDMLNGVLIPKSTSRISRLLYRDDIATQLEEQNRKLDTVITSFQFKSMIVVRSGIGFNQGIDENIRPSKPRPTIQYQRSKPQIIFGREKEIEMIVRDILTTENNIGGDGVNGAPAICILGPGGIGKTTLALSILHHKLVIKKFVEDRFFVPCETASSPNVFLNQLAASLGLPTEDLKDNIFSAILYHLKKRPCLIVLDNYETSWDPIHSRSEIEGYLTEITSIKTVSLIVTMRGQQQPNGTLWSRSIPPLQPVDLDSALAIFKTISQKQDQYVVELIKAVDCVPLAVTLMAKLAAVDGETPEALWSRWKEEKIFMVENGDGRSESLEASIKLSLFSPRMQRDPGALAVLQVFSSIPDGITINFRQACEKDLPGVTSVKKAISTLRQNALIYDDENKDIRILSPIRLYILARRPPSSTLLQFIHNHFIQLAYQGRQYQDIGLRQLLQRETNNINAILVEAVDCSSPENLSKIADATMNFCHFSYVSGTISIQAISNVVSKLEDQEKSLLPITSQAATHEKGVFKRAFDKYKKTKSSSSGTVVLSTGKEDQNALNAVWKLRADCLGCLGQTLTRLGDFKLAKTMFESAKDLHVKVMDLSGQAYDTLNIGILLTRDRHWEEALDAFHTASKIHEELGDKAGKAHDLLAMGHAARDILKFTDARRMFDEASELFEELSDPAGQSSALNGIASILLALSQLSEATEYFLKAVEHCNNTGDKMGEADNVAGLATTFLLRSNFIEAKKSIQKAISLRHPVVEADHLHILGRIYIAMGDHKQAKVCLSNSLNYCQDIGDVRGYLDNVLYLENVELHLGNLIEASSHIRTIWTYIYSSDINNLFHAEACLAMAQFEMIELQFEDAKNSIATALDTFEKVETALGKANCHYIYGILHLRMAQYEEATQSLALALDLHTQVGNLQGQADDLNKISECLMLSQSLDEAMTLVIEAFSIHLKIGDRTGQGDDLYLQGAILLAKDLFLEAEIVVRKAMELHTTSSYVYGIARDNALLSDILWQQHLHQIQGSSTESQDPFTYLTQAMKLFRDISSPGEFFECRQLKRRMRGKQPRLANSVCLPDYRDSSDEEDEDYTGEEWDWD